MIILILARAAGSRTLPVKLAVTSYMDGIIIVHAVDAACVFL